MMDCVPGRADFSRFEKPVWSKTLIGFDKFGDRQQLVLDSTGRRNKVTESLSQCLVM